MTGIDIDRLQEDIASAILDGMAPYEVEGGPQRLALAEAAKIHAAAATPVLLNYIQEAELRGGRLVASALALAFAELKHRIKPKYGYAANVVALCRGAARNTRRYLETVDRPPRSPIDLAEQIAIRIRLEPFDHVSREALKNLFGITAVIATPCPGGTCLRQELSQGGTDSNRHVGPEVR